MFRGRKARMQRQTEDKSDNHTHAKCHIPHERSTFHLVRGSGDHQSEERGTARCSLSPEASSGGSVNQGSVPTHSPPMVGPTQPCYSGAATSEVHTRDMISGAGSHRTRRPPMALVATALLAAPGSAFTASTLLFRHQQPSSSRRLQQRAWEQSSR